MKKAELIAFFGQFEMYARSGMQLDQALASMKSSLKGARAEKLGRVEEAVRGGRPASAALMSEFRLPAAVAGLIECGEDSGTLPDALAACRAMLERQDELMKKVLSAMAYPAVIGVATLALTIGLVEGVIPQMAPLLLGLHAGLPFLTRAVIYASRFVETYWLPLCATGSVAAAASYISYRRAEIFRRIVQAFVMKIPFIGRLQCTYVIAVFFGSCGSMAEAGISAIHAYEKAANAVSLLPLRRRLTDRLEMLARGQTFCAALEDDPHLPSYAASILRAGESSGKLGASMKKIAEMLEKELDHSVKRFTALLEPTMMLGMGGIVGTVVLSIMMPIYDISKALQR
jgi:type II secretory pathway component PulF